MTSVQNYEWLRIDQRGLARYIQPDDLPAEFRLSKNINRFDLLKTEGPKGIAERLYKQICNQSIQFDLAPVSPRPGKIQLIRKLATILTEKRGNSLDLTILFSAMCLDNYLLPVLVVIDGHVFAGLSLTRTGHDDKKPPMALAWDQGMLTDLSVLQELSGREYLFVECSGAASSRALSSDLPEGRGRHESGLMSFERACEAGREQIQQHTRSADSPTNPNQRTFLYALDIHALQVDYGFEPIAGDQRDSVARSQTSIDKNPESNNLINNPIMSKARPAVKEAPQMEEVVQTSAEAIESELGEGQQAEAIQQTIAYQIAQRALSDQPIEGKKDDLLGFGSMPMR